MTPPPSREPHPPPLRHPLSRILAPGSVAVVGASADPRKRGHQALRALRDGGYRGRVHAVNPGGGEILGTPVHRELEALPEVPDLVLLCTPAELAPDLVERAGRLGVAGAVVLAVGFGEAGPEGTALQDELTRAARETGIRVVGPNTSGILNLPLGLNLVGAPDVKPGFLALLTQSGNVTLDLMNQATRRSHAGISVAVGLGNEADLAFHEVLDYLAAEPHTRAVIVYAEGMRDARAFLETAARVTEATPVVVLKGGRSASGRSAARSHTGRVAGAYAPFRAGLRQAGVVEVQRTDELLAVAETLAAQPPARGRGGVAVLSDGGGQGTLAADRLNERGVPLAELAPDTREGLRSLLGEAAAVTNPVDLAGRADADPGVFARAAATLLADDGVAALLVVGLFGGYALRFSSALEEVEIAAAGAMAAEARGAGRPLVLHSFYAWSRSRPLEVLGEAGVAVVESLEVACRAVEAALERRRERRVWRPEGDVGAAPAGSGHAIALRARLAEAKGAGRPALAEPDARELLAAFGMTFAPGRLCRGPDEAARAVEALEGPAALKLVSPALPHKTEVGGVLLGVQGAEEARRGYRELLERGRVRLETREGATAEDARALLHGVLVSPLLPPPVAELLVGAHRDPRVGPVATLAEGGVLVEALGSAAHRVLPVDRDAFREMVRELASPVLAGVRGRPAGDAGAVAAALEAVARALLAFPELESIEVNPLFVYPDHAVGVDARAYLVCEGAPEQIRRTT